MVLYAGQVVTSATFDYEVNTRPYVMMSRITTSQSIPNGNVNTPLVFNSVVENTHPTLFDDDTTTGFVTLLADALLMVAFQLRWAVNATGVYRQGLVRVNGAVPFGIDKKPPLSATNVFSAGSTIVEAPAGTTLNIDATHDATAAVAVEVGTNDNTHMKIAYLGRL
jgi:hypothetical protein